MAVADWLDALETRYQASMSSAEFLKAVRALSWRYVERRAGLARGRALDSAGKRAAFASSYAPLHFLTTRQIVRALGIGSAVDRIVDLGCGTGVTAAAWALESAPAPAIVGVDAAGWTLAEAAWTWRTLGLDGRTRRGNLVAEVERESRASRSGSTALLFGWSVNELSADARARLLDALRADRLRAMSLLVIEPLARGVAPWWPEWVRALAAPGLRDDEWHFDVPLAASLARVDEAAGFRREALGARSLWRPAPIHRQQARL